MMSSQKKYDVIVIGAGPGGYNASIRCAQLGMSVACVEKKNVLGGTCLNEGCIPSKILLHNSHVYHNISSRSIPKGISITESSLDINSVISHKKSVVDQLEKGINYLFKKHKIALYYGKGSFQDPHTVVVSENDDSILLYGEHIIIASGSIPFIPDVMPKVDGNSLHDSTSILSLSSVPPRLAVIGGGYIGLEMASVWHNLGSQVVVFEREKELLSMMDRDISSEVKRSLSKKGIECCLGHDVSIKKTADSLLIGHASNKMENFDACLYALGRKPYVEGMDLHNAHVEVESGFIKTSSYRTSQDHIFAIGDCTKGYMLAHRAEEDAIVCSEIIAGVRKYHHVPFIPSVVYLEPEVASVGHTEDSLIHQKISYKKGVFHFSANSRASCYGMGHGFVKILVDKEDIIIGCHIVGPSAGELINQVVLAMEFTASSEDIICCVFAHPTFSEAIRQACMDVHGYVMQS